MSKSKTSEQSTPEALIGWQAPLVDLMCILAERKWMVGVIVLVGVTVGVVRILTIDPFYRSSTVAVLMPREKPTLDTSIRSGSLSTTEDKATRQESGTLMLPPNPDLYMALLLSRSVLERIAQECGEQLNIRGPFDRSDETIRAIKSMIKLSATEEGLLTVTVTANDPRLAAKIANLLVSEGEAASKAIERQLILHQAGYLDEAVKIAQMNLKRDEERFKDFCDKYKILDPFAQAEGTLRLIRETTLSRDANAMKLAARQLHFTDADPQTRQLQSQVHAADQRIAELTKSFQHTDSDISYSRVMVEFQSLQQEVRFRRDLLITLSTQADVFRIRAEQPSGSIAIVRRAVPVFTPAGPGKKKTLGVSIGASLFLAIGLSILFSQWSKGKKDQYVQSQIDRLYKQIRIELPLLHRTS